MQTKEVFLPYRRFDSWQDAQKFIEILEKKEIVYELEEYSKDTNPLIFNKSQEILLKLRQKDFEEAGEFVLQDDEVSELDSNHYLNEFTDEELIEILVKPHEWGELDRTFAPKLLIIRGYDLNNLDIRHYIQ